MMRRRALGGGFAHICCAKLKKYVGNTPAAARLLNFCSSTYFENQGGPSSETSERSIEQEQGFHSGTLKRGLYSFSTTDSLRFLGLQKNFGLWKATNYGAGIIIAIVDSGIIPDHPSFHDRHMQAPPARWKGWWELDPTTSNNKLIGARDMTGLGRAIDDSGHGSHVASTAGGNFVSTAHLFGQASGTAAGVAPLAHLAIYKTETYIQTEDEYMSEDHCILDAILAAIEDGADLINVSIGGGDDLVRYDEDAIAVGSFIAMLNGVLVISTAGNEGPNRATVGNVAPWILTVGASTIGRRLEVLITLSNSVEIKGESIFQPHDFPQMYCPIIQFKDGLNTDVIKGKIVLCQIEHHRSLLDDVDEIVAAGALAVIVVQQERDGMIISDLSDPLPMISAHISYSDGLVIKDFITSSSSAEAALYFSGTVIGDENAPIVASFSGRGPNRLSAGILKPDVIAPGVHIIAGWRSESCIAQSRFHIVSGTSMAAPHVTGVAALLKCAHPNWTPAAIKSAIMTTTDFLNCSGQPILDEKLRKADMYAMGAGQVNPVKAVDPGLIYDIGVDEYIAYLYGIGYTDVDLDILRRGEILPYVSFSITDTELNYPSISVLLGNNIQRYVRTVTNVGDPDSAYVVTICKPEGVDVVVQPEELHFSAKGERITYSVIFKRADGCDMNVEFSEGYLSWVSDKHIVRSPIVVSFV